MAVGTAVITVTTADGGFTANCTVTVSSTAVAVTGVSLNKTATTILPGGTETLTAAVTPANATNQTVTWSSDNTAVAAVNNGQVTAAAAGTAVITVTTEDGDFTANCTVTVSPAMVAVTGITGVPASGTVGTLTLTGTVTPANATNQTIVWSVKTVGTTGANISGNTLTATAVGTVVVTATIANGTAAGTDYTQDFSIGILSPAEQLAADLNAITSGSASASGGAVTLLADIGLVNTTITVPLGVTLDLETNHKSITLGNSAVLTVNGVVNAEASHTGNGDLPVAISGNNGRLLVDSAIGSPATINGTGVIHLKSRGILLVIENRELILDGVILDGLMTADTAFSKNITMPAEYADSIDNDNDISLVVISSGGIFAMTSGTIGYNAAGSGVYIPSGNFTMDGGEICGNGGCGLGVYGSSHFTMNNGVIHDNTSGTDGGGLMVNGGTFIMNGGVIKNNRARPAGTGYGGGVRLWSTATFIMAGGTVYGSGAGAGLANKGSLSSQDSLSIGGGNAYWGDGTTSISSTNGTLHGGTPTGTIE
jgi:hypothetical protein